MRLIPSWEITLENQAKFREWTISLTIEQMIRVHRYNRDQLTTRDILPQDLGLQAWGKELTLPGLNNGYQYIYETPTHTLGIFSLILPSLQLRLIRQIAVQIGANIVGKVDTSVMESILPWLQMQRDDAAVLNRLAGRPEERPNQLDFPRAEAYLSEPVIVQPGTSLRIFVILAKGTYCDLIPRGVVCEPRGMTIC